MNNDSGWKYVHIYEMFSLYNFLHRNKYWQKKNTCGNHNGSSRPPGWARTRWAKWSQDNPSLWQGTLNNIGQIVAQHVCGTLVHLNKDHLHLNGYPSKQDGLMVGSLPNRPLSSFSLREGKLSEIYVQVDFLSHQERESRERGNTKDGGSKVLWPMFQDICG